MIEDAIKKIQDAGCRVRNLFQLGDGWQANVSRDDSYFEFGRGATAVEALQAALRQVKGERVRQVDPFA